MPPKKSDPVVDPGDYMDDDDEPASSGAAPTENERPAQPTYSTEMPEDDEMNAGRVFLRLLNARSKVVIESGQTAGHYYAEEYGPAETLHIEPLGYLYKRNYFFRQGDTSELLCSAIGPRLKLLEGWGQPGGDCSKCALAEPVIEDVPGKGPITRASKCRKGYSFEVYVQQWGCIATWDVFGGAARASARIGGMAKLHNWGKFVIELSSKGVPSADGVNHVPILRLDGDSEILCPPILRGLELPEGTTRNYDESVDAATEARHIAQAAAGMIVDTRGVVLDDDEEEEEELPF